MSLHLITYAFAAYGFAVAVYQLGQCAARVVTGPDVARIVADVQAEADAGHPVPGLPAEGPELAGAFADAAAITAREA